MKRRGPGIDPRWRTAAAAWCLLLVLAGAAAAGALMRTAWYNRLVANGQWRAAKRDYVTLMGADQLPICSQLFAGNRLNLGVWHGFQELVSQPLPRPVRASFRFRVRERGYLVFECARLRDEFWGVRFSADPRYPAVFIHAASSGEFIEKRPLPAAAPASGRWHACTAVYGPDQVAIALGGAPLGTFALPQADAYCLGFRGGAQPACVDNVRVVCRGGAVFSDAFDNRRRCFFSEFWPLMRWAAAASMTLGILWWLRTRALERVLWTLTALGLCAAAMALTGYVYYVYVMAGRYPTAESAQPMEERLVEQASLDKCRQLDAVFSQRPPSPGETRILFVGTSQTWGAGARDYAHTYPMLIERALNENAPPGRCFTCINTGICGQNAAALFTLYETRWMAYKPDLTVIDLGFNDCDRNQAEFGRALEQFAALNRAHGVRTLFVREPTDLDGAGTVPRCYETMTAVAQAQDVPLVRADERIAERIDDGFLFWDMVHFTPYGHQTMAAILLEPIIETLGIERAEGAP